MTQMSVQYAEEKLQEYYHNEVVIGRDLSDNKLYFFKDETGEKCSDPIDEDLVFQLTQWDVSLAKNFCIELGCEDRFAICIPVVERDSVWLEDLIIMAENFAYDECEAVFPTDEGREYTQTNPKPWRGLGAYWEAEGVEYCLDMQMNPPGESHEGGVVFHHDYVKASR